MLTLNNFVYAYAVNALWQLPLLVLSTETAARLLAGARAATVHRLWAICFFAAILLPAASLLNPTPRPFKAGLMTPSTVGVLTAHVDASSGSPNRATVVREPSSAVREKPLRGDDRPDYFASHEERQTSVWQRIVPEAICLVYLSSVLIALSRLAWKVRRTVAMLRSSTPAVLPVETKETWLVCLAAFGLTEVDLLASAELSSPATLSWPKATVILPSELCGSGREELAAAFCHELAHVRRRDFLLNLFCEASAALLFFHPALHWMKRRLNESRELACDDLAAGAVSTRHVYARGLLRLAQIVCPSRTNDQTDCALGVFESGTLEKRVMNLIEPKPAQTTSRLCVSAILTGTLFLGCLAAGMLLGIRPVSARARGQAGGQAAPQTDRAPEGWFLAGSTPASYRTGVDRQMLNAGLPSAYLAAKMQDTGGFGTLMQSIDATKYAGKRVRLRATVRSKDVGDWAGVWMRVDSGEKMVAFDNMQRRPIRGDQGWRVYDVVLNVPQNATGIAFGILLHGPGEVWMNSVNFEVVDDAVATTDQTEATRSIPTAPVNLNFQR